MVYGPHTDGDRARMLAALDIDLPLAAFELFIGCTVPYSHINLIPKKHFSDNKDNTEY